MGLQAQRRRCRRSTPTRQLRKAQLIRRLVSSVQLSSVYVIQLNISSLFDCLCRELSLCHLSKIRYLGQCSLNEEKNQEKYTPGKTNRTPMGTSCSNCVHGNDVRTMSHHQSSNSFDPGAQRQSRSIFSTPSAQDDFLKQQRVARKRHHASQRHRQGRNQTNDDTSAAASPLFVKKSAPNASYPMSNEAETVGGAASRPDVGVPLLPSDQGSVGYGSGSWNENTTATGPPTNSKSNDTGHQRVINGLNDTAKPAPRKSRKQNLFFMPDA